MPNPTQTFDIAAEVDLKEADLSETQKEELKNLLRKHENIFSKHAFDIGYTDVMPFKIKLDDNRPIRQRAYKVLYALKDKIDAQLMEMQKAGIIQPSISPYTAPLVPVKKKDGGIRICTDFRNLNLKSVVDPYPLKDTQQVLSALANSTYFSTMDITNPFNQIAVDPESQPKTAFITQDGGQYSYTRIPFGVKNGPPHFQRTMDLILSGQQWKFLISYAGADHCL